MNTLEGRYEQYRQMSGGRFLPVVKGATLTEKIIKIKSLLKKGIAIDETVKATNEGNVKKLECLLQIQFPFQKMIGKWPSIL